MDDYRNRDRTATDIPALSHTTDSSLRFAKVSDSLGMPQGRGRDGSGSAPMEGEAGAPVAAAALPGRVRRGPDMDQERNERRGPKTATL
jgi:hypothetical protein